jgi:hypothetical protein
VPDPNGIVSRERGWPTGALRRTHRPVRQHLGSANCAREFAPRGRARANAAARHSGKSTGCGHRSGPARRRTARATDAQLGPKVAGRAPRLANCASNVTHVGALGRAQRPIRAAVRAPGPGRRRGWRGAERQAQQMKVPVRRPPPANCSRECDPHGRARMSAVAGYGWKSTGGRVRRPQRRRSRPRLRTRHTGARSGRRGGRTRREQQQAADCTCECDPRGCARAGAAGGALGSVRRQRPTDSACACDTKPL